MLLHCLDEVASRWPRKLAHVVYHSLADNGLKRLLGAGLGPQRQGRMERIEGEATEILGVRINLAFSCYSHQVPTYTVCTHQVKVVGTEALVPAHGPHRVLELVQVSGLDEGTGSFHTACLDLAHLSQTALAFAIVGGD